MSKLQVVMPMAGLGSRFRNQGIFKPKPFIEVDGMPMFMKALSSLEGYHGEIEVHVIVREESLDVGEIPKDLWNKYAKCHVHTLNALTKGAAETVSKISDLLDSRQPLLVLDCDLFFQSLEFINAIENCDSDGALLTFKSQSPKYSYAKSENGFLVEIAEKKVISEDAIIGAYLFSKAETFVSWTKSLLIKPISNELVEYYISEVFREGLQRGARIEVLQGKIWSFGTPEELENYLAHKY